MMGDMIDRCMDAMGSTLGSGMIGSGIMLAVLLLAFLAWVIGLATVGTLIFWGVRRLSRTSSANGQRF